MKEDLLRVLPGGEDVLRRIAELRAGRRPAGEDQIDATVRALLLRAGEALPTREIAERLHLAVETAARTIARLVEAGLLEGDSEQPRRYRVIPFFLVLPPGYKVARPVGKSWKEQIETPCFFPGGVRVVLYVVPETHRVHDGGAAQLRVGDESALRTFAAARGVRFEAGELVVDEATPELVVALAQAAADAVDGVRIMR